MSAFKGWCACDLDGTLAFYDKWRGSDHVGEPVPLMVERIKTILASGTEVRIFTARASPAAIALNGDTRESVLKPIDDWCMKHLGRTFPITHEKDMAMHHLYDDRAKQIVPNTGELVEDIAWKALDDLAKSEARAMKMKILGRRLMGHAISLQFTKEEWTELHNTFDV